MPLEPGCCVVSGGREGSALGTAPPTRNRVARPMFSAPCPHSEPRHSAAISPSLPAICGTSQDLLLP